MREPILRAVAMPPRIFFAPFMPAIANFVVQGSGMFLLIGLFDVTPLVPLATILLGHVFLAIVGTREPHLSCMLESWGRNGPQSSHNIYRARGVKLAP